MRLWALGAVLMGVISCGRASPYAEGSNYGVGVPRTNFTFGRPPQTSGQSTGFDRRGIEGTDYRPRRPALWPVNVASRLPWSWAQYRGGASKR